MEEATKKGFRPARTPHYLTPTKASIMRRKTVTTTATATTLKGFRNGSSPAATASSGSPSSAGKATQATTATTAAASSGFAPKRLYLIRHGESLGQAARSRGMNRRTDERLRDAPLTNKGIWQAQQLRDYPFGTEIQLVVSSPLTRALHTAILGFGSATADGAADGGGRPDGSAAIPILIHYDLAELGSRVPENSPRAIKRVLADLNHDGRGIDSESLRPGPSWPRELSHDGRPNRCRAIQRAMQYLHDERPERCVAVVCHYNVIRQILNDGSARPQNATPICCALLPNGRVQSVVNGEP